jgi:hypothetical protein
MPKLFAEETYMVHDQDVVVNLPTQSRSGGEVSRSFVTWPTAEMALET